MSNLRSGTYGNYYGSYFNESAPLDAEQMKTNARYIYLGLTLAGWTQESIAAILGNMEAESTINPGRWQTESVGDISLGYGLVQWTPSTKYTGWCADNNRSDPSEMDNALARILYEVENGLQWIATSAHSMSFSEFTQSTAAPATLAAAFLLNYERPANQSQSVQSYRGSLAEKWYTFLTGQDPTPPDQPGTGGSGTHRRKKKYNFVLFGRKIWRQ